MAHSLYSWNAAIVKFAIKIPHKGQNPLTLSSYSVNLELCHKISPWLLNIVKVTNFRKRVPWVAETQPRRGRRSLIALSFP